MIIPPDADLADGPVVKGAHLVIREWPASGIDQEVAPLHVHDADDEAWHVISGRAALPSQRPSAHRRGRIDSADPSGIGAHVWECRPPPSRYILMLADRGSTTSSAASMRSIDPSIGAVYARHASRLLEEPSV